MASVPNRYLTPTAGMTIAGGRNGHAHVYGRGVNGHPFYSKQAWLASKAHAQEGGRLPVGGPFGQGAPNLPGGGAGIPGTPGAGMHPGGYDGLQGVLQALGSGNITAQQLQNMKQGYTGGNGHAVGGMHGALSGLSDYAVNWLANSGLLEANQAQAVPTTDAQGNPLTGTALLLANIQNTLNKQAPTSYHLAQGLTSDQLGGLLTQAMQNIGQSAYRKGFNATGGPAPVMHPMAPGMGFTGGPFQPR